MTEESFHQNAALTLVALGLLSLIALLFIDAPYGRYLRPGWGPTLSNRVGWILMECPTLIVFLPIYFGGDHATSPVALVFLCLWLSHYIHRTLIYPFRLSNKGKRVPLLIALLGLLFNMVNAYLISRSVSHFKTYEIEWLKDPRFASGLLLFVLGYFINRSSDRTLLKLRLKGESGYRIPRGGLYEYVSCPNYLGEIVQWCGFALATWSLSGLAFAWYSVANLAPRALSHHRFYLGEFPNYPKGRKALIPFVL